MKASRWFLKNVVYPGLSFVVAVVVATQVLGPDGNYHALDGRSLQLPGYYKNSVVAVAVTPKEAPRLKVWMERYLPPDVPPALTAESPHALDFDAQRSREAAWVAAQRLLGVEVEVEWVTIGFLDGSYMEHPRPLTSPDVSRKIWNWEGASAGLAYALAYLDRELNGRLVPGEMRVAATGVVEPRRDGVNLVSPVVGVAEKAEGAVWGGATVMLVPRGLAPANPPLPIVEVSTLEEAVQWLCDQGGRAPSCAKRAKRS